MHNNENEYILRTEETNGITRYLVSFKDGQGILQKEIEVTHTVFTTLTHYAKKDESSARQDRRRIEQSELTEAELYVRAIHKPKSAEDITLENLRSESMAQAIDSLPFIQARRFRLYYNCDLTLQQIAEAENCTFQAVARSIKKAEKKIKTFLSEGG